jgi:hypothetical protein
MSGYGAIEQKSEANDDRGAQASDFEEGNIYYLKERTLTAKERIRKLTLVAVPLLAALLIVGGAAWLLLRNFGSLYPGPGGGKNTPRYVPIAPEPASSPISPPRGPPISYPAKAPSQRGPPVSYPAKAPTKTSPSSSSSSSGGASACSANSACKDLGLLGECCPTGAGVMLGCCS